MINKKYKFVEEKWLTVENHEENAEKYTETSSTNSIPVEFVFRKFMMKLGPSGHSSIYSNNYSESESWP